MENLEAIVAIKTDHEKYEFTFYSYVVFRLACFCVVIKIVSSVNNYVIMLGFQYKKGKYLKFDSN